MFNLGNGEEKSTDFDYQFMESSDLLYNLGLRLFKGSQDDAMDLLHDTYLRAKDRYHTFNQKSKFSTWIYSIAMNIGINKLKRKGSFEINIDDHQSQKSQKDWIENILDEQSLSTSDHLILNEEHAQIQSELNKLPDAYRIPLILFYYEGLPYKEIANQLGEKEGTIKSFIFRGKAIIKKNMQY